MGNSSILLSAGGFFADRFSSPYIGEELWIGNLGHLFIFLSFIAAILAGYGFYRASKSGLDQADKESWLKIGRVSFTLHGIAIVSIFVLLFFMIFQHLFYYHYVWDHSSRDLELKYMVACFWEGQEGSFLLWQFWHMVLGLILIWRAGKFEAPVMTVLSSVQIFLGTMLLGIFVFGEKVGLNPFVLLRDLFPDDQTFTIKNYPELIEDGNGLNILLQNYWMVIHPPVLFLGFASTLIPFAFAITGLWKKDYKDWAKAALPWALFSGGILGLGILMGGAWAYEALSFGGFWAWDPVENASLVPWLTMVALIHTLVIFRHSKHGLRSSFLFAILSFGLVLLSTYLTRSGVLGTTSVHSFTDAGLKVQLILFLLLFGLLPLVWLLFRWRKIPEPKKEEKLSSREFWMFVGSLVLGLSALQIGFSTCLPIFNILVIQPLQGFMPDLQEFTISQPVAYYNKFQILFGIIIASLTAVGQYFRYRDTPWKKVLKSLAIPTTISLVLSVVIALPLYKLGPFKDSSDIGIMIDQVPVTYFLLLFTTVFSIVANLEYLIVSLKKNWRLYGGSITHVGMALLLLGALISQGNQKVISVNLENIDFGPEFQEDQNNAKNRYLAKDGTVKMGSFDVTYLGRRSTKYKTFFDVEYKMINPKDGSIKREFVLSPFVQSDGKSMSVSANPATMHLWDKDIFTHVTSVPIDTTIIKSAKEELMIGDTIFTQSKIIVLKSIDESEEANGMTRLTAVLSVFDFDTTKAPQDVRPAYIIDPIQNKIEAQITDSLNDIAASFEILKLLGDKEGILLQVTEADSNDNYIIMKAIEFPHINILWLGCIVMVIGFFFSILRRVEENRKSNLIRGKKT